MEQTKVCTKCGETKPLEEFHKRAAARDGLRGQCKKCVRTYRSEYRSEHLEVVRAQGHTYRAKRKEARRAYDRKNNEQIHARWLENTYGISLADYDEMLEAQDNSCAICGKTPEENGKRLAVDHNHGTGEVRGLLCDNCNRGIGNLQDSSKLCRLAADYLHQK